MNTVWNLDRLYCGFDDPLFLTDFENLKKTAEEYVKFAGNLEKTEPLDGLRTGIRLQERMTLLGGKLAAFPRLRSAADSKDGEAGSWSGRIMSVQSSTAGAGAAFRQWACAMDNLMELVRGDDFLKDYEFFFAGMLRFSCHNLGVEAAAVAARMRMSGSSAWSKLHGYLTSTVRANYRGRELNLSAVRNLARDPDMQVRRDAYEAELACYEAIKDPCAHAMNAIKLETLSSAALGKYESPLAMTLERADMKRETLDAMLGAMDEYLPKFWQYLKTKARLLGHENGLPWYDLFAPVGSDTAAFTVEEARDFLLQQFATFDDELTAMAKRAFDEEWIDFYPRDGKRGGAFCSSVQAIGESRILTNFDGSSAAVTTLAHELGHAFHNLCIRDHRPLNHSYSMPVAETASTFNECVVMNAAIAAAKTREEKMGLIESQLQKITQVICDIYSRFRFEAKVFENREERFMDADTLCEFMIEAQKQSYGDGLDHDFLHPYMWVNKQHYYGPVYYNFPYAFGALFSRGLYARYEKEGAAFVETYKKLLHTTTVATAEDTAMVAGIDLTDKNFWRSALQTVADRIDQFCELAEV